MSCVAQNKGPAFDLSFQLYLRREELRQEDNDSSAGTMTVASRIIFEKLKAESDDFVLRARERQVC